MNKASFREYNEWRTSDFERSEDAAYSIGYYFVKYCKDEVIEKIKKDNKKVDLKLLEDAIDNTLHNVMDMFEGFWKLEIGNGKCIELELKVNVKNNDHSNIESISISPGKLDLPIGFWKWCRDREFK